MRKQLKQQDEQLRVEHGRVVDSHPSSCKMLYTLYAEALQAVHTRFPTLQGGSSTLCMLQPSCITTCTCEGGLLDTPVAGVAAIWPCTQGLLLQDTGAAGVLLMDHPLNVPTPVVADVSSHAGSASAPMLMRGLTGWAGESILWSTHLLPITVTLTRDTEHVTVWAVEERCLQPDWLGNLPDLPVHTPAPGTLGTPLHLHTAGTDKVGPQVHAFMQSMTPGAAASPLPHHALATPPWPSAVKRPAARTSTGMLSPAMFSTRPRHTQLLPSSLWHARGRATTAAASQQAPGMAAVAGTGNATIAGSLLQGSCTSLVRSTTSVQAVFELVAELTIPGVQPDSECFPIRDADKQLLLAVHCPSMQQVCLIPLTRESTSKSSSTPPLRLTARAAVLLSSNSTQPLLQPCPSYVLLLGPAGELAMCWGVHPICNLAHLKSITHASHGTEARPQQSQSTAALDRTADWELQPAHAYTPMAQAQLAAQQQLYDVPSGIGHLTTCAGCSATVTLHMPGAEQEPQAEFAFSSSTARQADSGESIKARVHIQPSSWLCEQVLQLLQDALTPTQCSLLLKALHHHAGFLSSDSQHSWSALVQVLACALQQPCSTTATAEPAATAGLAAGTAVVAASSTPELFNSPGSTRFAALSLASPAVTRNLFSPKQSAQQQPGTLPPAASRSLTDAADNKAEVSSVAWQQLAAQLQHMHAFNLQRYSSWSALQPQRSATQASPSGVHLTADVQQVAAVMAGLQGLLHTQGMDVLRQLHFLYEDFKLDVCRWGALQDLGLALASWANALGTQASAYWEHYACDLGPAWLEAAAPKVANDSRSAPATEGPWDIFRVLQQLAQGQPPSCTHQPPPHPLLHRTHHMLDVYGVLQACATRCSSIYATACFASAGPASDSLPTAGSGIADGNADDLAGLLQKELFRGSAALAVKMAQLGLTCQHLDNLPAGVALPLRDMLAHCRCSPPTGWPAAAYALVGREDIAATLSAASSPSTEPSTPPCASTAAGTCVTPASVVPKTKQLAGAATPASAMMDCLPTTPTLTPSVLGVPSPFPFASLLRPITVAGEAAPTPGLKQTASVPVARTPEEGNSSKGMQASWPTWSLAYQQRLHLPSHLQPLLAQHCNARHGKHTTGDGKAMIAAAGRKGPAGPHVQALKDQVAWLQQASGRINRLRFNQDDRLMLVSALLSSSIPVPLQLDLPEADPELPAKQQQQLLAASLRTMALPVGRGALSMASTQPLPTEPLTIPPLCLSGLTGEQLTTQISLDLSAAQPAPGAGAAADITAWPEFHNGVAAGLRLLPAQSRVHGAAPAVPASLHSSLVFQRPDTPTYTHAGLLLALGLTGHLSQLAWTDLYRYLSEQHDATTIGAMLGRAACYRGSMEVLTSKMLFLHLPSTHPSSFPELDMSPSVQSAALLGAGLLYQGTCHRQMAETMLNEIGRSRAAIARPGQCGSTSVTASVSPNTGGVSSDREAYALAAGFALGLITLGTGRQAVGLQDLNMEARLRWYLLGSSSTHQQGNRHMGPSRPGGNSSATLHLPRSVGGLQSQLQGLHLGPGSGTTLAAQLQQLGGRELHSEAALAASTLPQVVLEHSQPSLSVTSPAACMALCLMFLKTNDQQVAEALSVPDTHTGLASVRPDLLTLRVLARGLVMWETVLPTKAWLNSQMTSAIQGDLPSLSAAAARPSFCTSSNSCVRDAQAVLLAHLSVLSGACLALGLRYAGSANADAVMLLREQLATLLRAKVFLPDACPVLGPCVVKMPGISHTNAGVQADKGHVEACVCTVALALGLVMAGTGHLPTLQLLEALGKRRHASHGTVVSGLGITYGCHMAISMATGLLFLGAGSQSLSTKNEALAALLIAVYPHFPTSPTDNRCHLQAFRHLYVLAAQPRCVEAIDVATHQPVYLPLTISLQQPTVGVVAAQTNAAALKQPNKPSMPWPQLQQYMTPSPASQMTADAASAKVVSGAYGTVLDMERIAPCLLPEMDHVRAVSIHSSRYWPQTFTRSNQAGMGLQLSLKPIATPVGSGSHGSIHSSQHGASAAGCVARPMHGLAAGTQQSSRMQKEGQVVFVKKMASSLAYADDPSGIRSLLSQSYAGQGSLLGAAGASTQLAGTSQHLGMLAPVQSHSAHSGSHLSASHDITHLCATFSADPSVMGFAQALQQLIQLQQAGHAELIQSGQSACQAQRRWSSHSSSGAGFAVQDGVDGAAGLLQFCLSALYECILGEKPEMLMVYIQLYTAAQQTKLPGHNAVAAADWAATSNSLQYRLAACNLRSLRAMWEYMPGPLVTATLLSKAGGNSRPTASMLQQVFVEGLRSLISSTCQNVSAALVNEWSQSQWTPGHSISKV